MDVTDQEMISQDEVDSPLPIPVPTELVPDPKPYTQSSIYSLTLDELQNTVCESGKDFGSMNMDEFLSSIWIAEEHQAQATNALLAVNDNIDTDTNQLCLPIDSSTYIVDHKRIAKQSSLPRQGSIALSAQLFQKTVEEVWAEIHRSPQSQQQNISNIPNPTANSTQERQLTYAEMTLEDFLIRAGVVTEPAQLTPLAVPIPQPQTYGFPLYPNTNPKLIETNTFVTRPVMKLGGGVNVVRTYQPIMQPIVGEIPTYHGAVKRGVEAPSLYGRRMGNVTGGSYAQVQPLSMVSHVSPNSPDGSSYGRVDVSGTKGRRKRVIDSPVEKVVERRQRRMVKNRESAARSRERKQAYTVELEAELNQIKEENTHLKEVIARMDRKERQQVEEMKMKTETNAKTMHERLRTLRRTTSSPA